MARLHALERLIERKLERHMVEKVGVLLQVLLHAPERAVVERRAVEAVRRRVQDHSAELIHAQDELVAVVDGRVVEDDDGALPRERLDVRELAAREASHGELNAR